MATRAIQFDFLLAGLRDPDTGEPLNGGSVEFYVVGTSTPKNVWTEEAKTNAYTSYTLDTNGVAELYGDGLYKILVKDSTGALEYTFSEVKMQSPLFLIRTVSSPSVTVTPEDDMVLCNSGSNNITVNLEDVDTFQKPVIIKKISPNNTVTIDPYSSQYLDDDLTYDMTENGETITAVPDSDASIWRKSNHISAGLVGLTATADEINDICDQSALDLTWFSATTLQPQLIIKNTNADTNAGYFILKKLAPGSAADDDDLGTIQAAGYDDGDNDTTFAEIVFKSSDVSDGNEAGRADIRAKLNGTTRSFIRINGYNGAAGEGEIVVNEDGQDIDFRIEASGVASALAVRGSDGQITIGGTALTSSATELNALTGIASPTPDILKYLHQHPSVMRRAIIAYNGGSTAYTFTFKNGFYRCKDKLAWWEGAITSPAPGSPTADTWYYVYLDYSAITSGTEITASELLVSTTKPTWSASLGGYYNIDDLCIYMFKTNSTPDNALEVLISGDFNQWADEIESRAYATPNSGSWVDVQLDAAPLSIKVLAVFIIGLNSGTDEWAYYRTKGQTGTTGHTIGRSNNAANDPNSINQYEVVTDSDQYIQIKEGTSGYVRIGVKTSGWYLPEGM